MCLLKRCVRKEWWKRQNSKKFSQSFYTRLRWFFRFSEKSYLVSIFSSPLLRTFTSSGSAVPAVSIFPNIPIKIPFLYISRQHRQYCLIATHSWKFLFIVWDVWSLKVYNLYFLFITAVCNINIWRYAAVCSLVDGDTSDLHFLFFSFVQHFKSLLQISITVWWNHCL